MELGRSSERKANGKRIATATGTWSLKRTGHRLSERAQFQHPLIFVLGFREPIRAL